MSENYSEMSTEELKKLYYQYKHESEVYSISQLVKKILLSNQGHNVVIHYWDCCENGKSLYI